MSVNREVPNQILTALFASAGRHIFRNVEIGQLPSNTARVGREYNKVVLCYIRDVVNVSNSQGTTRDQIIVWTSEF